MSDMILEAMARKQVTALVLLDLSKAFDSIEHGILLRKLRELNVSIQAMEWFRSYLMDRNQRVRIGCEVSDPRQVAYGVPQGLILGRALFNIYINDLPAVPNLCSLKSYVDDSQLYLSFRVQETAMAVEHLSEDLQRIAAWCCTHSLLINPDKTKLLLLGTPQMLARVPEGFGNSVKRFCRLVLQKIWGSSWTRASVLTNMCPRLYLSVQVACAKSIV